MKVVKELPKNMTGHIIVFNDPLLVEVWKTIKQEGSLYPDEKGQRWKKTIEEIDRVAKCKYMRAGGGFGCFEVCSGRMIIGDYFETIEQVKNNEPVASGNTKCYPDGHIPELFREDLHKK